MSSNIIPPVTVLEFKDWSSPMRHISKFFLWKKMYVVLKWICAQEQCEQSEQRWIRCVEEGDYDLLLVQPPLNWSFSVFAGMCGVRAEVQSRTHTHTQSPCLSLQGKRSADTHTHTQSNSWLEGTKVTHWVRERLRFSRVTGETLNETSRVCVVSNSHTTMLIESTAFK